MQPVIVKSEDVATVKVGTMVGTAAAPWLLSRNARLTLYATLPEACDALLNKEIDAVIYEGLTLSRFALQIGLGKVSLSSYVLQSVLAKHAVRY
jgi:ABC-type amino acid transport substrate-binding protein